MPTWTLPRYGRTSLWFDKGTLRLWFFEQRHQARTSYPACVRHFFTESNMYFEQALLVISYLPLKLIFAERPRDHAKNSHCFKIALIVKMGCCCFFLSKFSIYTYLFHTSWQIFLTLGSNQNNYHRCDQNCS